MTGPDVIQLASDALWTTALISAPIMLVGLGVGVIIALFQALTQIQEMTLVFVPKLFAMFTTLLVVLPFIGEAMSGFMERLIARIVAG